jgi:hypothetical protein
MGEELRRGSAAGYGDGARVVLPFDELDATTGGATICFRSAGPKLALAGQPDPNADNVSSLRAGGRELPADLAIQLVRPGRQGLLDVTGSAFHRAALFRPAWVGAWTYYALAALGFGLVVAAAAVAVLAAAGRVPRPLAGAGAVAAIAFGSAVAWSLVMPPFQPPDEAGHFAYVQSLVERGELPSTSVEGGEGSYTLGEALAVERTAVGVVQNPAGRPPWTELEEDQWRSADQALGERRDQGGGGYTSIAAYSPIYYGMEALPYMAGNSIFSKLWLMRLLSALMIAATAFFAYLFARELLPNVPWAAPAAGLVVAFQPMLGFMGGAVNNDALLILLATAELYLLARALRSGLSLALGAAIGTVLGLGIATKPTMFALAPLAAAVVAWTIWEAHRRKEARGTLLRFGAAAVAAVALVLGLRYAIFPREETISGAFYQGASSRPFSLRDFLSYVWQWYLPHLPWMQDRFAGAPPVYDVYFKGFWANFAHLDTKFAPWVYGLLLAAGAGVLALLAVAAFRARAALRRWLPGALLCALTLAGLALIVNLRSYLALIQQNVPFAQGRYLLPAVCVLGVAVAASALALGRRWAPVAATAFVTALGAFNLFSLGLVVTRFYT